MTRNKVTRIWTTIDVVAAACAAYRVNGAYVMSDSVYNKVTHLFEVEKRPTNRSLVYQYLEDESFVTDADRLLAEDIKEFYKGYAFKVLRGDYLSEYDRKTIKILEEPQTSKVYDIALLTSLPSSYLKAKKRDDADRRTRFAQGGYVGKVGDKVTMDIEVLQSVYSKNWATHYITAINSQDQSVFFAYKQEISAGTLLSIKGTVKRHRDDGVTQLNRVRIVK